MDWLRTLSIIGFDTETNFVDSILARQLKVLAIATEDGSMIWVVEWDALNPQQQQEVLTEISKKLCIIQSVSFDYSMLAKYGVKLEKVYDTYLAEVIMKTGLSQESSANGLQAIYKRRFDLDISKDEQLTFGDGDPYTDDQIRYAAIDTVKLGALRKIQIGEMKAQDWRLSKVVNKLGNRGLIRTQWIESETAKVIADIETNGLRLHKGKWYNIEDEVMPVRDKEFLELNQLALSQYKDILLENNWVSDVDELTVSVWTSSTKKKLVLEELYNFEILKTAKTELKKYLRDHDPKFPEGLKLSGKAWEKSEYPIDLGNDVFTILKLMIMSDKTNKGKITSMLDRFLMTNMKQFCIDNGWYRKAGELSLNWASQKQRLILFQAISPMILSTGKEVLEDWLQFPLIVHYLSWSAVDYQIKNFGKRFYDEHVQLDGRHRARYNQILSTGRMSSSKPNVLNIPRKIDAYRKAVIPGPGRKFINADYDGQELFITAHLAGETSWLHYLEKGYDLHSKNSELIFGQRWKSATEPGCQFYAIDEHGNPKYKKCKCTGHMEMRDHSKAVSFGSIYGISKYKLSFNLKITVDEAEFILKRFWQIVPNISKMMNEFGAFAIENGYIIEPVLGRLRFFDKWKLATPEEHGAITRAAFNFPIQSAGGAILKIAMILLRRKLNQLDLNKHIILINPYHDELSLEADPDYAEIGRKLLEDTMMKAAAVAGFPGLRASASIGDSWYDCH